uniref:Major facilitator superfamily (MFS) profile domain-containing protein n=1 Tax=Plectus sambesii TaxID=2011161 RepID=A0A914XDX3_9BILA
EPDGGYGWVIVLAAFFSNFVVDGMANCFAVFLPEYQRFFNSSKGTTALVGSLLIGSYLLIGPVAGGLVNKYGARPVVMAGAVISTVAIVVSVYSTNIFIFMIIFGVCGGIGFGLIYLPAIVMVGYYFEKKRALATGIAVAGSGVGTFVFPPLAVILIEHFGWQGTLWLLSGLVLNCAVFGALYLPLESRRDPTELQRKLSTQGAQLKNALSRMSFAVSNIGSEMDMRPASVISKQQNGEQPAMLSPDTPARRFHPTPIGRKNSLSKSDLETFARIRSALSECEDGLSRADGESPSSPVKTQLSPIEEHRPLAKSRSGSTHHAPIFVPPRSRKTTLTSQISDYSRLNLNTMSRRDLVATNQISRLSARSYAQSLSRINGSQPLKAAQSLFSVQGVDPKEFTRPMSRRDIFLQGSITNLPEFKEEGGNFKNFRESQISIPMAVLKHDDLVDGPLPVDFIGDDDFYEEPAPFLCGAPAAVRNVFAEMVDVSLLRDPVMVLLCVSNILGMLGFYVPFVFYVDMAMKNEIAEAQASLLLSYIGITNTLGRIFFGWFADQGWVSALTINNAALVACGIITLACPLLTTYYLMVAYAIIFGFIISSYICLTSIILSDLLGVERLTNSFGLLVVSRGIACLIGSPIA